MWSQRAASSRSCVTSTKAVPRSRASCSIRSKTLSAVSPSRLPVGSSASTQVGWTDQRARHGHALPFAAGQLGGMVRHALGQPYLRQHLACRLARLRARLAANAQRHGHVVQRAELRQQMVELVDEAEVTVAPAPLFGRIQRGEVAAHQFDLARGGRIQPAQQVQQRALARARGADDGQRLAGTHLQVDATQHLHVECVLAAAFAEALVQAFALQDDLIHSARLPPG